MQRTPALVKVLPRQPGTKEARYAHLLCGDVEGFEGPVETAASSSGSADDSRVERLENEMADLRREVNELKQQMESFKRQFE